VLGAAACSQGGGTSSQGVAGGLGALNGGSAGASGGSAGVSGSGTSLGGAGTAGAKNLGGSGGVTGIAGGSSAAGAGGAGAGNGGTTSAGGVSGGGSAGLSGATNAGGGASDTVDASKLAPQMGFGANIGNTFDNTTAWETGWGEPLVTQAYINGMASRGIKTVRVPVAWDTYAKNGVIDATDLNRVKEVVGWIEAAGMYSIVNIHWDGGWIDNENNANKYKLTSDVTAKFASYWQQIATGFSGVDNKLIFEGLNEEGRFYVNGDTSQAPDYAALNQLNQLFVTTVRAQSGFNKTRALLIAGFNTDIDLTCVNAFTVPSDPAGEGKLFLSIHYYTPYTFTGLDTVESWGSPATTWGTDAEKATLQSLFSKLATFSAQKNIPVIIGEFGVTLGVNYVRTSAARTLWMESVAQAALSHGMVPVLWDTGSDIKRTDGSFSPELQTVINAVK
jgi:endoglucanase